MLNDKQHRAMYNNPVSEVHRVLDARRAASPSAALTVKQLDEKNALQSKHHGELQELRQKQKIERDKIESRVSRPAGYEEKMQKDWDALIKKHTKEKTALAERHQKHMEQVEKAEARR